MLQNQKDRMEDISNYPKRKVQDLDKVSKVGLIIWVILLTSLNIIVFEYYDLFYYEVLVSSLIIILFLVLRKINSFE